MFYGLFLGLIEPDNPYNADDAESEGWNGYYTLVMLLLVSVLGGFVVSVFVMPFFSKRVRPLPVSFALLVLVIVFYQQVFRDSRQDCVVAHCAIVFD